MNRVLNRWTRFPSFVKSKLKYFSTDQRWAQYVSTIINNNFQQCMKRIQTTTSLSVQRGLIIIIVMVIITIFHSVLHRRDDFCISNSMIYTTPKPFSIWSFIFIKFSPFLSFSPNVFHSPHDSEGIRLLQTHARYFSTLPCVIQTNRTDFFHPRFPLVYPSFVSGSKNRKPRRWEYGGKLLLSLSSGRFEYSLELPNGESFYSHSFFSPCLPSAFKTFPPISFAPTPTHAPPSHRFHGVFFLSSFRKDGWKFFSVFSSLLVSVFKKKPDFCGIQRRFLV